MIKVCAQSDLMAIATRNGMQTLIRIHRQSLFLISPAVQVLKASLLNAVPHQGVANVLRDRTQQLGQRQLAGAPDNRALIEAQESISIDVIVAELKKLTTNGADVEMALARYNALLLDAEVLSARFSDAMIYAYECMTALESIDKHDTHEHSKQEEIHLNNQRKFRDLVRIRDKFEQMYQVEYEKRVRQAKAKTLERAKNTHQPENATDNEEADVDGDDVDNTPIEAPARVKTIHDYLLLLSDALEMRNNVSLSKMQVNMDPVKSLRQDYVLKCGNAAISADIDGMQTCKNDIANTNDDVGALSVHVEEFQKSIDLRKAAILIPGSIATTAFFTEYAATCFAEFSSFIDGFMQFTSTGNPATATANQSVILAHITDIVFAFYETATFTRFGHAFAHPDHKERRIESEQLFKEVHSLGTSSIHPLCRGWVDAVKQQVTKQPGNDQVIAEMIDIPQLASLIQGVWKLHLLGQAYLFTPDIIRFAPGDLFDEEFSEVVGGAGERVLHTVWPGFSLSNGEHIIKSKVVAM